MLRDEEIWVVWCDSCFWVEGYAGYTAGEKAAQAALQYHFRREPACQVRAHGGIIRASRLADRLERGRESALRLKEVPGGSQLSPGTGSGSAGAV